MLRPQLPMAGLACYHPIVMNNVRNIRLTLAYDGTEYCGWQVQSNGPTVQAKLEKAIEKLTGKHSAVYSAGRTDSGVHALGQVANFHTKATIPAENFRPALQSCLRNDIVILDSREVAAEFHATFWAKKKRYRYVIDNTPVSLPFLSRYSWQLRRRLDDRAMQEAASTLLGTHDFRSFETEWPNKATSVRTVMELEVTRRPLWQLWLPGSIPPPVEGVRSMGTIDPRDASLICVEITADGFLYNMVRSIVGTLVNVGRGKWTAADVAAILAAQKRSNAGSTAPACGLFLVDVDYG